MNFLFVNVNNYGSRPLERPSLVDENYEDIAPLNHVHNKRFKDLGAF